MRNRCVAHHGRRSPSTAARGNAATPAGRPTSINAAGRLLGKCIHVITSIQIITSLRKPNRKFFQRFPKFVRPPRKTPKIGLQARQPIAPSASKVQKQWQSQACKGLMERLLSGLRPFPSFSPHAQYRDTTRSRPSRTGRQTAGPLGLGDASGCGWTGGECLECARIVQAAAQEY